MILQDLPCKDFTALIDGIDSLTSLKILHAICVREEEDRAYEIEKLEIAYIDIQRALEQKKAYYRCVTPTRLVEECIARKVLEND